MPNTQSPPPLRVLEAVKAPDGTTRFVDQVIAAPDDDIEFRFMSLRRLVFLSGYHVVHFHWPEMLVRDRRPSIEWVKSMVFRAWVARMRRRRIGILRTVHNPEPHEQIGKPALRALERLDQATDVFVTLNPSTQTPTGVPVMIPHGHYRERFGSYPETPPIPNRILYAGLIRPYKGVESLIKAFRQIKSVDAELRIVGKPTDDLRRYIEAETALDTRISSRLEFVPDGALVDEVRSSTLVCLPYRELHNSGILLVALSLNRPVLVPSTESTRAMSEEVGIEWITLFEGELDTKDLEAALESAARIPEGDTPNLQARDWRSVGRSYSAAFRLARDRALRRP